MNHQVSVETSREHPFYVGGKGWCSCDPQRTLARYDLPCKQLVVGDCCLALSRVSSSTLPQAAAAISSAESGARSSTEEQVETPIDYSRASTVTTT